MPPKKKAANGYNFAERLPKGTILSDIGKKFWRLGPSIGKGGFGEIYSAQEETAKGDKYPYVVKIEPHTNGPLFVEINFYIRHGKAADIENFKKEKGLKSLGMPVYYGSGSHEYKGNKYRFLIMDKFSTDLYKLFIDNNKIFPVDTVFKVGLQLIDVLEYIHQKGYVHADIKAANILLGASKDTQNKQIYLVDFGLATKFTMEKEFKPNPKKAHDGTIEFLSRDAHQGVQTRRGDLEILAYNLIQWLGCKLPWESNLSDPKIVQKSKEDNMSTVQKMIKASFGTKNHPKAIADYLSYIKTLRFDTEPDYHRVKMIFLSGVKEANGTIGTPLQFSQKKTPSKRTNTPLRNSRGKKAKSTEDEEMEINGNETPKPKKKVRRKKDILEKDDAMEVDSPNNSTDGYSATITSPKRKGRKKKEVSVEQDGSMEVDTPYNSDDEENFVEPKKRTKAPNKHLPNKPLNKRISKSLDNLAVTDPYFGFTDAMKDIMRKKMEKAASKKRSNQSKKVESVADTHDDMSGYTEEMKAIALKKKSNKKGTKNKSNRNASATSSKAGSKRGLAKLNSKVVRASPQSHDEVRDFSDVSDDE